MVGPARAAKNSSDRERKNRDILGLPTRGPGVIGDCQNPGAMNPSAQKKQKTWGEQDNRDVGTHLTAGRGRQHGLRPRCEYMRGA